MKEVMMSDVLKQIAKEAFETLLNNATQTVRYVALGSVMKRDLAAKYGMAEVDVAHQLARVANDLCSKIGVLKLAKRT